MSEQQDTELNYDEFIAFVMLYAAKANLEFKDEELDIIHSKVSDEEFDHVKTMIDQMNDYQCLEVINQYHDRYLNSDEKRKQLLDDIHKVFEADHHIETAERVYETMLKKIL